MTAELAARRGCALTAPGLRAARLCLHAAFAAMCAGAGWRALTGADATFGYLFLALDWDEAAALRAAHAAGWALLAAAALVPFRRAWPLLVAVAAWTAAETGMAWADRVPWAHLLFGERAVRWLGPLALAVLIAFPDPDGRVPLRRVRIAVGALVLASCATFVSHGWRALAHDPTFLDLIFMASTRVLGAPLSQQTAEALLLAIGAVDLIAAALLAFGPARVRLASAAYMAVWGGLTALSRTVHSGFSALPETLLRAPNAGVPLALLLCAALGRRRV